ncbi:MAG: DUF4124 domain-containing protein [Zoogloeaceae bacterium]|jgi:hypothetical protein|nr:DUF4124 domain-containing protein [Zoogloeaceae bacterium]
MHIRLTLAVLLSLAAFSAAQADVYKWKDAQGRTIISDTPQPGKKTTAVPSAKPDDSADDSPVKTLDDQDLEFRKRQEEREAAEKKQNEETAAAARKSEACERSRRNLDMLESGARISRANEQGAPEFINDQQREAEISRVRQNMQANCSE